MLAMSWSNELFHVPMDKALSAHAPTCSWVRTSLAGHSRRLDHVVALCNRACRDGTDRTPVLQLQRTLELMVCQRALTGNRLHAHAQ